MKFKSKCTIPFLTLFFCCHIACPRSCLWLADTTHVFCCCYGVCVCTAHRLMQSLHSLIGSGFIKHVVFIVDKHEQVPLMVMVLLVSQLLHFYKYISILHEYFRNANKILHKVAQSNKSLKKTVVDEEWSYQTDEPLRKIQTIVNIAYNFWKYTNTHTHTFTQNC